MTVIRGPRGAFWPGGVWRGRASRTRRGGAGFDTAGRGPGRSGLASRSLPDDAGAVSFRGAAPSSCRYTSNARRPVCICCPQNEGIDFDKQARADELRLHGRREAAPHNGEIGNGRSSSSYNVRPNHGNSAVYLAGVLRRDYPGIADRLAAGGL
jgi:hypothetical protein